MKQAIATAIEYTETQKAWAVAMYRENVPSSEVERKTGVKAGYVRTLSRRLGKDIEKAEAVAIEPVSVVSPIETPAKTVTEKRETRRFNVGVLDMVFYVTTITACAGFITVLHWWAAPVSLVYALILIDALRMAKDPTIQNTAERGQGAVFFLEFFVAFPAHILLFNWAIWQNYKSLPFEILHRSHNGELVRENADKPFYAACFFAGLLTCAALYAVDTTIRITRERAKHKAQ